MWSLSQNVPSVMVVRCLFLQCLIVSVTEFPWRQTYSPSVRIRADEASGTERTVEMRHSWELAVAGLPASRLLHTVGGTNRPFLEGPGGDLRALPGTPQHSVRQVKCLGFFQLINTVIPRLTKIIRSGITFVSRNVISRRFL